MNTIFVEIPSWFPLTVTIEKNGLQWVWISPELYRLCDSTSINALDILTKIHDNWQLHSELYFKAVNIHPNGFTTGNVLFTTPTSYLYNTKTKEMKINKNPENYNNETNNEAPDSFLRWM